VSRLLRRLWHRSWALLPLAWVLFPTQVLASTDGEDPSDPRFKWKIAAAAAAVAVGGVALYCYFKSRTGEEAELSGEPLQGGGDLQTLKG
jgi:hypothetical protein